MLSFQKVVCVIVLAVIGMAGLGHSAAVQSRDTEATIIFEPTMYLVYPTDPKRFDSPTSQLEVQRSGNMSILENIAIFENIPATAKTCTLGWAQAAIAERTPFIVDGSGLLGAQQLPRIPEGQINWESIAPIVEEAVAQGDPLLHPDTTSWPDIKLEEKHIAGPVDCAEAIYLKLQVDYRNGDGFVYLGQDSKNGLTITVQG
ncbi:hypothetical protein F4861DRAFT_528315 [Xylaria intraflava]|nr:hypothetical protein F4861DRAFT_528315 [Xylaria intraflava]